jgi:hypothetical protein
VTKYLRKQLRGEMIYFGLQFQRFQSMVSWLLSFQSCGEAVHHTGRVWQSRATHRMVARKSRGEQGKEESGNKITLQNTLPLPQTRPHIPVAHSG